MSESGTAPAIEAEALGISAAGSPLLENVCLRVEPGEILLLAGPSGAGKSVLLRLLAGLVGRGSPGLTFDGELRVFGQDVLTDRRAARGKVGLVFQDFALFTGMTAGQNVEFALAHRDPRPEKARAKETRRALLRGLKLEKNSRVSMLSGGQKQRVAIARALAFDPRILAYDEPTSGLDPALARDVGELIRKTSREHGTTTVVVTHDLEGLVHVADRVVILDPELGSLEEVEAGEAMDRLRTLAAEPPPRRQRAPLSSRLLRGATRFFEGSFRVVEGLGSALLHLPPVWRSFGWGFRFFRGSLRMVAGPGSLLYFLLAGAVIGLVATYFTFNFLPIREYSEGLLLDDLVGALGFGLHRILVPLLITILLAARAGAAISADVSTRVAGRQDEAMRSLGATPSRYLLTGSLWAFLVGTPVIAVVSYLGARAASAAVFAVMAPHISLHEWSAMFHRLLTPESGILPIGSGWVAAKYLCAALGIAAIAYFRGAKPKHSPGDVARAITSTVIWSTVLVLAIHTAFAMLEF